MRSRNWGSILQWISISIDVAFSLRPAACFMKMAAADIPINHVAINEGHRTGDTGLHLVIIVPAALGCGLDECSFVYSMFEGPNGTWHCRMVSGAFRAYRPSQIGKDISASLHQPPHVCLADCGGLSCRSGEGGAYRRVVISEPANRVVIIARPILLAFELVLFFVKPTAIRSRRHRRRSHSIAMCRGL